MHARMKPSVEAITALRAGLFELVAVAVILALGMNLFSSGIIDVLGLSGWTTVSIGLTCSVLGIAYLSIKVRPANSRRFDFEGIIPIEAGKDRKLVRIERYDFSEKVSNYFRGLCAENKAFAKQWRQSPLGLDVDIKKGTVSLDASDANQLVREAIEYYVLSKLSLHLSSYFENNPTIEDNQVIRLDRKDIPAILLENRFLELFSKPMAQREAFLDQSGIVESGRVVYAHGKSGEVFDEFELILPKNTVVVRSPGNWLEIRTKRFKLRVKPVFEGFSANLPWQFEELFLGYTIQKIDPRVVSIIVDVDFGLLSLFSVKGWEYYRWLDSFLQELESAFSFEHFIQEIGWSVTLSTITSIRNFENKPAAKPAREDTVVQS